MNELEEIVRVAAKGDGVTASGRHVPLAAPGDCIRSDGTVEPGPHHAAPPCRHFGRCGGCDLQHLDEAALAGFVSDRAIHAALGQGLTARNVAAPHLSPPHSRRRAAVHAVNGGGRPLIGFRERGSHRIVDLAECPVLHPELLQAALNLRKLLGRQKGKYSAEIELTLIDQGVDCGLKGIAFNGFEDAEYLLEFARANKFARLTVDEGFGPETRWEPQPATVELGGVSVPFPPGSFLQATHDGEAKLSASVCEWLKDAKTIADLFSGLGTFGFALAGRAKVLAVEAARDAHLACKAAAARSGTQVHALHRDLFRNPLQLDELNRFDAVVLDPPRAGAREQVGLLAGSKVRQIAYISCNPASWARDAKMLVDGGYELMELRPVGQFRWSTHVELASHFVRN